MENSPETAPTPAPPSRTRIAVRLLYTVLFLIVFGVVHFLINLTVLFQYILLFITQSPSEPVRRFANQLTAYAYRLMRYLTLNDNDRPFPFSDFPPDLEPPAGEVKFD
ncbi:MAG: DUF4389 domain-containing protein [Deltaproteobacteria bacterium]|nr:DUF4389 domain-containing protein [Deltaproteobacteria bacterium]